MKHFSLLTVFLFILFAGCGCADWEEIVYWKKRAEQAEEAKEQAEKERDKAEDMIKEEKRVFESIFE